MPFLTPVGSGIKLLFGAYCAADRERNICLTWAIPRDCHDGPRERIQVKEDKEVGKKLMWLEVVIPKEESEKPIAC